MKKFLCILCIATFMNGCAFFGKSRYSFTDVNSEIPSKVSEDVITNFVDNLDPSIVDVVEFTKAAYTAEFIQKRVVFYDDQIVMRVVPDFSQPENFPRHKREFFLLYLSFCNKIGGTMPSGQGANQYITSDAYKAILKAYQYDFEQDAVWIPCNSADSKEMFSVTNPDSIETYESGRIRHNFNVYITHPKKN